jgi:hypothetical protein
MSFLDYRELHLRLICTIKEWGDSRLSMEQRTELLSLLNKHLSVLHESGDLENSMAIQEAWRMGQRKPVEKV